MPVLNGSFLDRDPLVLEQREEFLQVDIIELCSLIQLVRKPSLCSQNLWRVVLNEVQFNPEMALPYCSRTLGRPST